MIENIIHNEVLFAIIIRADYKNDGIEFFTPDDFSQQLGYMTRRKGYIIKPHLLQHQERKVSCSQKILVLKSGKVRIDIYDREKNYLKSTVISGGDIILLAEGIHGFEMIEDAEIIEIKQGPYHPLHKIKLALLLLNELVNVERDFSVIQPIL